MAENKFPKIDLHLHLDGSLSYPFFADLAKKAGLSLSEQQIRSAVTAKDSCKSLKEYLTCFDLPSSLLRTEQALTLAALDLIRQLEQQGLYYAEIRFAPQLYTQHHLTQQQTVEAVLKGVELARQEHCQVRIGILLCMFVTGSYKANRETAELAVAYRSKGVVGLDLAGPEGAVSMSLFAPLFQIAYQADLPFTIHAGECGDYENINRAVSFGAKRIGHGCAALFSESCMKLLQKEQITLEMCPTSNLQTKAISHFSKHPIRTFFDRGLLVTVNTDNMTVSNTSLEKEYARIKEQFLFTDQDIQKMNENAARAAFSPLPV